MVDHPEIHDGWWFHTDDLGYHLRELGIDADNAENLCKLQEWLNDYHTRHPLDGWWLLSGAGRRSARFEYIPHARRIERDRELAHALFREAAAHFGFLPSRHFIGVAHYIIREGG
ncbi:MAG: hypothetical protein QXT77_07215 [Candidatus Methanomethylicaceae archaeon]